MRSTQNLNAIGLKPRFHYFFSQKSSSSILLNVKRLLFSFFNFFNVSILSHLALKIFPVTLVLSSDAKKTVRFAPNSGESPPSFFCFNVCSYIPPTFFGS